jgi:nitroreductase
MSTLLKIIQQRQSARVPFEPNHPIPKAHLKLILEAAKWTPTAHNMQNYEIIVIDDKTVLEQIGKIKSRISEEFLRENYEQLSFSKEELEEKKTGILAAGFPPAWVDPAKMTQVANETTPIPLTQSVRGSPTLLMVLYDSRKRAPASGGDVLGFMSLGCLMENIWLMAQSLGVNMQILSSFATAPVENELKQLLEVPEYLKIAYTCRLGYSTEAIKNFRVRRNLENFTHHNKFGKKGT